MIKIYKITLEFILRSLENDHTFTAVDRKCLNKEAEMDRPTNIPNL